MIFEKFETFGLMKTLVDAHTMGVHTAAALLRDCGYRVIVAPLDIEAALDKIISESEQRKILKWIKENRITRISFSYRLDSERAVELMGRLVHVLKVNGYYGTVGAQVRSICFAGLKSACDRIDQEYEGHICTFRGGESAEETLLTMGIPSKKIPKKIKEGCQYDKDLIKFGEEIIYAGEYKYIDVPERNKYPEYGTLNDTLELRLHNNYKSEFQPIIRAHSGPYSESMSREDCLKEYKNWCYELAKAGLLDILSVGSSQLSQSHFGENWGTRPNGGGVPVNSEAEYIDIWKAARPMLVRTYSGTKNIQKMAEIYERTINIAWHALSLWWFDELDGRGPNPLYTNLQEHISTIKYIARVKRPFEANVSHHFAFRGCDDITYIVSAFLAAKLAKKCGIRTFVLQNMLNTPRSTWGIQDLSKSRALLKLVKELEDENFKIILQTRAGLDYFKPDLQKAKIQLAAVTAMMDDIDSDNLYSPEIIHVVSYCEALFLATPDILNDSIKITREALRRYRKLKKSGLAPNVKTDDTYSRTLELEKAAKGIIRAMEENIPNLYSPEGFYIAFVAGWLPVPELWSDSKEFLYAKDWETQISNGGIHLAEGGIVLPIETRINKCISNIPEAQYILTHKYL